MFTCLQACACAIQCSCVRMIKCSCVCAYVFMIFPHCTSECVLMCVRVYTFICARMFLCVRVRAYVRVFRCSHVTVSVCVRVRAHGRTCLPSKHGTSIQRPEHLPDIRALSVRVCVQVRWRARPECPHARVLLGPPWACVVRDSRLAPSLPRPLPPP